MAARLAHMKRSLRVRATIVGVLEELPFICPLSRRCSGFLLAMSPYTCG